MAEPGMAEPGTGRCLCGAVRYSVNDGIKDFGAPADGVELPEA